MMTIPMTESEKLENLIESTNPTNPKNSNDSKKFKNKYRKHIRLQNYDYSQNGDYFITLSCHQRRPLFGAINNDKMELNPYGKIAQYCWKRLVTRFDFISLDEYIFMPNHFHGIIRIRYAEEKKSKSQWRCANAEADDHADTNANANTHAYANVNTHANTNTHARTQPHSINAIVRAFKSETTRKIRQYIRHGLRHDIHQRSVSGLDSDNGHRF